MDTHFYCITQSVNKQRHSIFTKYRGILGEQLKTEPIVYGFELSYYGISSPKWIPAYKVCILLVGERNIISYIRNLNVVPEFVLELHLCITVFYPRRNFEENFELLWWKISMRSVRQNAELNCSLIKWWNKYM